MGSSGQYANLLAPGRIGQLSLKNRIVMSAMGTRLSTEGYVTQRLKSWYEARAKGGVGLIITESTAVHPAGLTSLESLRSDEERFFPGLHDLAQCIHRHGARVALQLHHTGPIGRARIIGSQPVAASPIRMPLAWGEGDAELPRELTSSELGELAECFAVAARRAKEAEFDAVEIHAGHRFLINSFLSPAWNRRSDQYGGNLVNRARFLLDIIRAVRKSVGPEYPILCKLNGEEIGLERGIRLKQTEEVALMAQNAGVDAIDVTSMPTAILFLSPGSLIYMAEAIKKVVNIPVMTVGRITPRLGDEFVQQGKADFVVIGRAFIADPEIPNKLVSGLAEDILPCVGCESCRKRVVATEGKMRINPTVICTVNATAGRERQFEIEPASRAKSVVVVGGGPAGMEVARVAALRGHRVVLYEKDRRLGGALVAAGVVNNDYGSLTRYLSLQIRKLGVRIELGKEATPLLIEKLRPDVVVLAVGAIPLLPRITGIEKDNVVDATNVGAITSGRLKIAKVIVVIGAGIVGCEVASFLTRKHKKVTLVELPETATVGMVPKPMDTVRSYFLERLVQNGVEILTGVSCEQVTETGLVIMDKGGSARLIPADTIIVAGGVKENNELYEAVRSVIPEAYRVGDCRDPRGILEAIHDGHDVARTI